MQQQACFKCGATLEGKAFCTNCGAPAAPALASCPACGAEVSPGWSHCGTCGASLPAGAPPAKLAAAPPTPRRSKRFPRRFVTIVGLFLLGIWVIPQFISGVIAGMQGSSRAATTVSLAGMGLSSPSGWLYDSKKDSVVIAANRDDLTAAIPAGPRVRVELVKPVGSGQIGTWKPADGVPPGKAIQLAEPPSNISVGGKEGIAVAMVERLKPPPSTDAMYSRYVTVNAGRGQVYHFTFEAKGNDGDWDKHVATFDKILKSVEFQRNR